MTIQTTGHYFEFERGQWVKDGDAPTQFFPASGLAYAGHLTLEQRMALDKLIQDFIDATHRAQLENSGVNHG